MKEASRQPTYEFFDGGWQVHVVNAAASAFGNLLSP